MIERSRAGWGWAAVVLFVLGVGCVVAVLRAAMTAAPGGPAGGT